MKKHPVKSANAASGLSGPDAAFVVSAPTRPKVALVASIAWTLWNYRTALIQSLEAAGYDVLLLAADDASREKLLAESHAQFVPLQHINRKSLSIFQNSRLLLELYQLLHRHRPDVVLFFTIRPNTLGNFAAAAAGIPAISTVEGMGISSTSQPWLRFVTQRLYRLAFRFTRKVIFLNNEDHAEFLQLRMVAPAKAVVIHGPGIDLNYFAPRPRPEHGGPLVFLFVARLLSGKGIREFAAAARQLKNEGVAAEFQVLGSTDAGNPTTIDDCELQAWADEGILTNLGFEDDVRPAMAAADVLVLPSYYREGVPRSILEAMAMEKVILTTDNVGCRDTVTPGKNGFLVPPRDTPALVEAIKTILQLTPGQRREMGVYSRQKATAEFSDDLVLPRYLELIRAVLDSRSTR